MAINETLHSFKVKSYIANYISTEEVLFTENFQFTYSYARAVRIPNLNIPSIKRCVANGVAYVMTNRRGHVNTATILIIAVN